MIRTVAVNCAAILVCSQDDGKRVAEKASNEMVMGAVQALCEFSLLVSQQNHSDQSHKAKDNALHQLSQMKGIFLDQKMSKSAKAKVDDPLATESHQLHKQMIHKIHARMEALVYGADQDSTTKRSQFQLHLNQACQAETTSSDADRQKAIEQL